MDDPTTASAAAPMRAESPEGDTEQSGPGVTRREILWTLTGIVLALGLVGLVFMLTRSTTPPFTSGLVRVDRPAPDVMLTTLDGTTMRLSAFRGKTVLVNFWASWCEPCKAETPELVRAAADFKDRGLIVLGINLTDQDSLTEVRRFIQRYAVSYPIVLDSKKTAQNAFGIYPIPVTYIIDPAGHIRAMRTTVITRADIELVLNEFGSGGSAN